jgi:hypothetical protein
MRARITGSVSRVPLRHLKRITFKLQQPGRGYLQVTRLHHHADVYGLHGQWCDGSRSVLTAAGEGCRRCRRLFLPLHIALYQYYSGPFLNSLTQPETHLLHLLHATSFRASPSASCVLSTEGAARVACYAALVNHFVPMAPMTTDSTRTLLRRQHRGRRLPWRTNRHDRFVPATAQPSSLHTRILTLLASPMKPNR